VNEDRDCGEVDAEMESFPSPATETDSKVGGDNDNRKQVQRDAANGVFQRLTRRMQGVNEVDQPKWRRFNKEQVKPVMRPTAEGAVPESHKHPERHTNRYAADGRQANVRGQIQDTYAG